MLYHCSTHFVCVCFITAGPCVWTYYKAVRTHRFRGPLLYGRRHGVPGQPRRWGMFRRVVQSAARSVPRRPGALGSPARSWSAAGGSRQAVRCGHPGGGWDVAWRRLVPAAAVSAAVAGAANACVSAAKCEDTAHAGEVTGGAPADGPAGKADHGGNPLWPGQLERCIAEEVQGGKPCRPTATCTPGGLIV
jgi:hypothetical protein